MSDRTERPPDAPAPAGRRRTPLGDALLVLGFGALLAAGAAHPAALVFDEVHYVPAARALIHLSGDLNWEHPPLAKWIMGLGDLVLHEKLGLMSELAACRIVTAAFGLWALLSVAGLLRDLGIAEEAVQAATWLSAFNVLWFVQSRTAMLDPFSVAFALAGVRRVWRGGPGGWAGWAELGFAMACKWSAAPLCVVAVLWARAPLARRAAGVAVAVACYALPFLPLALLARDATPPGGILAYQLRMLRGFGAVDLSRHPYASRAWQWPTLLRPIWYHFEQGAGGERAVWAGGNPLLFALALPATLWLGARTLARRADGPERAVAALYWAPLLFWAALPRVQLFYYFLAASLWLGPAVVLAVLRLAGPRRRAGLVAIAAVTLGCALLFTWFLPILDGRLLPAGTYGRYMWLTSWR